jgi:hypothetical protein
MAPVVFLVIVTDPRGRGAEVTECQSSDVISLTCALLALVMSTGRFCGLELHEA